MVAAVGTALSGTSRCTAQLVCSSAGADQGSGRGRGLVWGQEGQSSRPEHSRLHRPSVALPAALACGPCGQMEAAGGPAPARAQTRRPRASACPASFSPASSLSLASESTCSVSFSERKSVVILCFWF